MPKTKKTRAYQLMLKTSPLLITAVPLTLAAGCNDEAVVVEKATKNMPSDEFKAEEFTDNAWDDSASKLRQANYTRENLLSIGDWALSRANFTELNLPNVESIGLYAFAFNYRLKKINLPNCTTVRDGAFTSGALTEIYLPKLNSAGDTIFLNVVNNPSTKVTLPVSYNTPRFLTFLFGAKDKTKSPSAYDQMSFTWVDANGAALNVTTDLTPYV